MPSTAKRNFATSIEKSETQLHGVSDFFGSMGLSTKEIKKQQADFLKKLYRKQIHAVLAIFGLLRNANKNGEAAKTETKEIDIPDQLLERITETSNLDPRPIVKELNLTDEGETELKLRAMMDDIYLNCLQISQKLGIEFSEKKHETG